jgi:uncharacterized membrane protein (UPF0127 family)
MSISANATAPSAPAPTPAVIIKAEKPDPAADILFHVQIAATPDEHANGLRGRPSLAADAGLLFVFQRPGVQTMSMKNNLIALDMIFIGADQRIVGIIKKAPPRSPRASRIDVASQFVLQIRAGLTSQYGFKVGQPVTFRAVPGV